ncbi:MAG TPA: ATP-binding protein [Burkholderiales bacterium]|nr:ATP-binding protein [Burkholderiales bacterium]
MRHRRLRRPAVDGPERSLLDALPVPVAIVDERGGIVAANRAMQARAAGSGTTFAARFPAYHAALAGGSGVRRQVTVTRNVNGAAVRERLMVEPMAAGAAVTVLDETPVIDAQTTRLASLGFMVAGVCHEVSNPLAAIHSMVQILQARRGTAPELVEKGLASISSNIGRVLAITRTLTDFSRVHDEPMRPIAVAQAVEEAASLLKHRTGPNAVVVDAAIGDDAIILARTGQLEQVVFNILLNAAQAMAGGGRVKVEGSRRGARVVLALRDEGPGIAAEHLGRIFEPFFTTKPDGGGTGLGLAISSEILHELGGELRAENLPGGGACFVIELPAADATP